MAKAKNKVRITTTNEGEKTVVEIVIGESTETSQSDSDSESSTSSSSSDSSTSSMSDNYSSMSDEDDSDCDDCECSDDDMDDSDESGWSDEDDYSDEYGDQDEEYGERGTRGESDSVIANPPMDLQLGEGDMEVVLVNSNDVSGDAVIELLKTALNKNHDVATYLTHLCSRQGEAVVKYVNATDTDAVRAGIDAARRQLVMNYGDDTQMATVGNVFLEIRPRTATPPPANEEDATSDEGADSTVDDSELGGDSSRVDSQEDSTAGVDSEDAGEDSAMDDDTTSDDGLDSDEDSQLTS